MNAFRKTAFAALAVASIMGGLAGTGAANAAQRTADDNFVMVPGSDASAKQVAEDTRMDIAEHGARTMFDAPRDTYRTLVPGDSAMQRNHEAKVRQQVAQDAASNHDAPRVGPNTYVPGDGSTSNYR